MRVVRSVHEDGTLRIACCDNLIVAIWSDAPELSQMRAFGSALQDLARRYPSRTALCNVVVRGTPNFSDPVRQEALRLTKDRSLYGLGAAHLIMLEGLAGVATRAFLSTLLLVASRAPIRIFGDREAAAEWLAGQMAAGGESAFRRGDILAVLDQAIAGR